MNRCRYGFQILFIILSLKSQFQNHLLDGRRSDITSLRGIVGCGTIRTLWDLLLFTFFCVGMVYQNDLAFARRMDAADPLRDFRDRFHMPELNGKPAVYFTGNSLGLQPKTARAMVEQELLDWQMHGVEGHFMAERPWYSYHHHFSGPLARLVGAKEDEVVAMNALTVNLHLMMLSFYRPTASRFKIIIEGAAFPSDKYAVATQAQHHGFDPKEAIIQLHPRAGEHTLRTEDILQAIADAGDSLALVMLGAVNYYTGQFFDIAKITEAGHAVGAMVGYDCAHATGNVDLRLHERGVDFAVWCSYKYMNSGPGGVSGVFVHEKHGNDLSTPRLAGWWGNDEKTRFEMAETFIPQPGAAGWQMSNAPVFNMVIHKAALDIFDEAGFDRLRNKSEQLTGYLEFLLNQIIEEDTSDTPPITIITPKDPAQRGCQLSLLTREEGGRAIFDHLTQCGVIADWRKPNVIRIAPVPLYNSFEDVYLFASYLKEALMS